MLLSLSVGKRIMGRWFRMLKKAAEELHLHVKEIYSENYRIRNLP